MALFSPKNNNPVILEYIWLASDQSLRSKTKTYYGGINSVKISKMEL